MLVFEAKQSNIDITNEKESNIQLYVKDKKCKILAIKKSEGQQKLFAVKKEEAESGTWVKRVNARIKTEK